jgi:hypothetical protein
MKVLKYAFLSARTAFFDPIPASDTTPRRRPAIRTLLASPFMGIACIFGFVAVMFLAAAAIVEGDAPEGERPSPR